MAGDDNRMTILAEERAAFMTMRDDLIRAGRRGYAVVQNRQLVEVSASWEEAFDHAIKRFGTKTPFLIERIEERITAEAPALVLGLLDPKLP